MMLRSTSHIRRCPRTPGGFTLLEVLVSLSIFLVAYAALAQLYTTGSKAAIAAALETQAVLRCESKLAELIAGVESLEAGESNVYEDDSRWAWSLSIGDGPHLDVLELTVTVVFQPPVGPELMRYRLVRYVRDPQLFVDAAAAEAEAEEGGP